MDPVNIPAKFEVRSFTHSWHNRGYFKKLGSPWIRPRSLFSQILKRLLIACTLWIYLPNLNFVALWLPEIIGGTVKIWEVPGYAHAPFSPKFLRPFVRMDAVNIPVKFEVRKFTRSWDNRGYWKNLGRPWIRPRSLFSQIFNGLLLGWTLWIYVPYLKFVPLGVPEIIWGTGQMTLWRHHWRHVSWINYPCGRFIRTMQ